MSKPKMIGKQTGYIPNAKADMRHHKKVYQHSREKGGNNMSCTIQSCNGCVAPKRYPGCHAHCPEYAAEKAADAEKKAAEDMRRKVNNSIYQQRSDMVAKALRRHGRK